MRPAGLIAVASLSTLLAACAISGRSTTPAPSLPASKVQRALVLGGGGATGQAWELGILKGLQDAGIDLTTADLIVGTSAGSVLGAEIRTGRHIDELYATQSTPPSTGGVLPRLSPEDTQYLVDTGKMWQTRADDPAKMRVDVGQRALQAPHPASEASQIERWERVLRTNEWPSGALRLSAVDVSDGSIRLFDRTQDAPMATAVAASTAIPGMFAPITVGGHRYMDGGVGGTHIGAASGYGNVVAIVTGGSVPANLELDGIRSGGSRTALVSADALSLAAMGADRMVVSQMKPAAEAGLRQAAIAAPDVRAVWDAV